jgi:hypothetical protein
MTKLPSPEEIQAMPNMLAFTMQVLAKDATKAKRRAVQQALQAMDHEIEMKRRARIVACATKNQLTRDELRWLARLFDSSPPHWDPRT